MTKRQGQNKSQQLTMALQVLCDNAAKAGMNQAVVKCVMSGPIDFEFHIKPEGGLIEFDPIQLAREVEKILPNVRVTSGVLHFSDRSITIVAKELGKKGTYSFTFVHVRA